MGRDTLNLRQRLVADLYAGTVLVFAMGLMSAKPEAERLARRLFLHEVGQICGVIDGRYVRGRRRGLDSAEGWAGQQAWFASYFAGIARPPAFARKAGDIAVCAERLHERAVACWIKSTMIARRFKLPTVAAGQHGSAGGRTLGVWRVGAGEPQALARHAVVGRRLHPAASVGREMLVGRVIRDAEQNIGFTRRERGSGAADRE